MNEDRKSFCLEGEKERVRLDFTANQMSDKIPHVTSSTHPELDALYEEREKNGKLQTQLEEHQKELENNATQIQQLEKEVLDKTLKIQELEQDLQNNFPSATGKLAKIKKENENLRNNNEELRNRISSQDWDRVGLVFKSFLSGLVVASVGLTFIYFNHLRPERSSDTFSPNFPQLQEGQ